LDRSVEEQRMYAQVREIISGNAERITGGILEAIRLRSDTWHYLDVSDDVAQARIFRVVEDMQVRLGIWLAKGQPESTLFASYSNLGADRCQEGIPLEETTLVFLLIKREVWKIFRDQIVPGSRISLIEFVEINYYLNLFFDRIIQSTIAGYQNEQALIAVKHRRAKDLSGRAPARAGQFG